KELAHRAARIRSDELQWRRLRRGRRHDNRIFERAVVLQGLDDLGDSRALLADCDIDAVELSFLVAAAVDLFLVEDSVDGECGLAGLAIADNQLALAAPNRHQR